MRESAAETEVSMSNSLDGEKRGAGGLFADLYELTMLRAYNAGPYGRNRDVQSILFARRRAPSASDSRARSRRLRPTMATLDILRLDGDQWPDAARRILSAVRLRPRRLRGAVREKAQPPARNPRQEPPVCRGELRAPRTAKASIRAFSRTRAAVSGSPRAARRTRRRAWARSACRSPCDHWRRAEALRPACGALSGGRPARGRQARDAHARLNGHGFLAGTTETAIDAFFAPHAEVMSRLGRKRGCPPFTRAHFDIGRGPRPSHRWNARRGDRQDPRSARNLRPSADAGPDDRRRAAPNGDSSLDRASEDVRGAGGARGARDAESSCLTGRRANEASS